MCALYSREILCLLDQHLFFRCSEDEEPSQSVCGPFLETYHAPTHKVLQDDENLVSIPISRRSHQHLDR